MRALLGRADRRLVVIRRQALNGAAQIKVTFALPVDRIIDVTGAS
jgi:hypothetical protein